MSQLLTYVPGLPPPYPRKRIEEDGLFGEPLNSEELRESNSTYAKALNSYEAFQRALRLLEITGDKTDIRVRFQESTMQPVQVFQSTRRPRTPSLPMAEKLGYWETE